MSTPATNNDIASLSRRLNDQDVSVTQILWLATLDSDDLSFSPVERFLEDADTKEIMATFGLTGKRAKDYIKECFDEEDYGELIRFIAHIEDKKGLLLCVTWGSISDCSEDMRTRTICGTTWKWFYTEILDDAFIDKVLDEVEKLEKKTCKAILAKKAAGGAS